MLKILFLTIYFSMTYSDISTEAVRNDPAERNYFQAYNHDKQILLLNFSNSS